MPRLPGLSQNPRRLAGRLLLGIPPKETKETPMMYLMPFLAALALASPVPAPDCTLAPLSERRVFTNADLERMAACRYQTGALSEAGTPIRETSSRPPQKASSEDRARIETREADWRARWRSVDQKARRLRREARELRQEAALVPRDAKKAPTGRRSPSFLIGRAREIEAEAKDLEDEFQERARREGALPGWLRPKAR
ncbi:MAG: hypothetical protein ABI565_10015 [Vicinamibacteria bacterium]